MAFYAMPRDRNIRTIIVKNFEQNTRDDNDVETLRATFEQFRNSEVQILESENLNQELAKELFGEFNVIMIFVLSDFQAGYCVSKLRSQPPLDIGQLVQSVAGNSTLLGYPKVLVFISAFATEVHDKPLSNANHLDDEYALGDPGQSLANPELSGDLNFFWDVFVAKIVSGPTSSFIKELCEIIRGNSSSKHFVEIFKQTIVKSDPGRLQMLNQLRKELFLQPGNYRSCCLYSFYVEILVSKQLATLSINRNYHQAR